MEFQALQVLRGHKEYRVHQEIQDHKVYREQTERRVCMEFKAFRVTMVPKDLKDCRDHKGFPEQTGHKVQQDQESQ
jgi:hypothetical protein